MDRAQAGHYRTRAKIRYLELKHSEFQGWFVDIMRRRYPTTFITVRLAQGDKQLDAYRLDNTVFAVYAPRDTRHTIATTIAKITSDFDGAKETLQEKGLELKKWVFVSNDREGIPADIVTHIAKINETNETITIEYWEFEAIWIEIAKLGVVHLEELFGSAPTEGHVDALQFKSIKPVIEFVRRESVPPDPPTDAPDVRKLEFNELSDTTADFLRVGRRKERLVGKYFDVHHDPTLGEEIAQAFREKYRALREANLSADTIFCELWTFVGGGGFAGLEQKAAVLAILSHFFESCDIFENPVDR